MRLDVDRLEKLASEKREDVYRLAASELFSVKYEDVTPAQRRIAKARLFGECTGPSRL